MPVKNPHRLAAAGPINAGHGFPDWFRDGNGLALEIVTNADPLAPAIGEFPKPGLPTAYPGNFPEEAFYYMAEARLDVGGNGQLGRARVIMALEAAFGGDGEADYGASMTPPAHLGAVFARLRVRIDDVIPFEPYVVRHPYGETKPLEADDRGRVAYTCDLGLAEGNMQRVLTTGEIAPFLKWATGAPAGYIGDGVTERKVVGGPFRNLVEIAGKRIGQGSPNAAGLNLVRTDLFTIQGRRAGTGPGTTPAGPVVPSLQIISAEFRTSQGEYRIRGQVAPVTVGGASNMVTVKVGGVEIGRAFPDATGAWSVREPPHGTTPTATSNVVATSKSGLSATRQLTVRS